MGGSGEVYGTNNYNVLVKKMQLLQQKTKKKTHLNYPNISNIRLLVCAQT